MYRFAFDFGKRMEKKPFYNHFYRHVFVSGFNIPSHPPKRDTCGKCDKLEICIKAASDENETLQC